MHTLAVENPPLAGPTSTFTTIFSWIWGFYVWFILVNQLSYIFWYLQQPKTHHSTENVVFGIFLWYSAILSKRFKISKSVWDLTTYEPSMETLNPRIFSQKRYWWNRQWRIVDRPHACLLWRLQRAIEKPMGINLHQLSYIFYYMYLLNVGKCNN